MESIENIVDFLDRNHLMKKGKIVGKYYSVCCPFHEESHPSCGILLEDEWKGGIKTPAGFTHCFACKKVSTIDKVIDHIIKKYDLGKEMVDTLLGMITEDMVESSRIFSESEYNNICNKLAYQNSIVSTQIEYVTEEELRRYRYTCKYMYDRGLTDDIIEKYDIGFDKDYKPYGSNKSVPCVTFPVKDVNGNVLFIARRAIQSKKFYLPKDIEKPVYGLYELPNTKSVAICEGVFDALTLVKYGQPAIALFGTGTPYQINQIKRYVGAWSYNLCLDADEAGIRGTKRLSNALSKNSFVWRYEGIPEGKDINDLSYDAYKMLNLV